jgi:hypothetical protein
VGTRRPAAGYGVRASAAAAGDAAVVDGWALSCSAQRCGPFIDGPSHHGPPREEATAEWPHHPMRHRHPATPRKIPQLSPSAQPPAPPRMASGSDAEQQQKRAAAAAYDYEGDARWAEYWSNVLVPAHLASRPDVIDHFKRKFYQRFIVSTTTDYQAAEPALPPKLVRSHLPVLMLLDFDSSP